MNHAIYECSCQSCGNVWRTSVQGLQRPCPKCSSFNFLYEEVTQADIDAADGFEPNTSRWPLRVDIAIGVLIASTVWFVVAVLAGVGFWLLAADAVSDSKHDSDPGVLDVGEVFCPDGQSYDPASNGCS